MCNEFFRYWGEATKDGKKLKWEKEDTWEVNLRLIRWKENDDKKKLRGASPSATPVTINKPDNLR